jgi:hypothetical protein
MATSLAQGALPSGTTTVVVPMRTVYTTFGLLFLVAMVGGRALYRYFWGPAGGSSTWIFWLLVVGAAIGHEGLHGLAMVLCGVRLRDVRFGFQLSRGAAYATTATPMSARGYRLVCALPLVVLGAVPLAAGLACGQHLAAELGGVMVAASGGDVAILLALRGVAPDARVMDHGSEPGFHLLPQHPVAPTH